MTCLAINSIQQDDAQEAIEINSLLDCVQNARLKVIRQGNHLVYVEPMFNQISEKESLFIIITQDKERPNSERVYNRSVYGLNKALEFIESHSSPSTSAKDGKLGVTV
jgi:hypothetical protein